MTLPSSGEVAPLTPSGFGGCIATRDGISDGTTIRDVAVSMGVALVKGLKLNESTFRELVASLGVKVSYEDDDADVGYGFSDVLHLDGTREEGKVITGRGPLPLHTDGILLGTQVDLIILYAERVANLDMDGATIVCDQMTAWREMPSDLRDVLLRGYLEYKAFERGYFTNVPEGWYPIPTFRDYGRVRSLNLALPFEEGAPASWAVRVPGVSDEESRAFFEALRKHLSSPRYLYEHHWKQGDLIVIDNQRTLHGRQGLANKSSRELLRGQVTFEKVEGAPGATPEASGSTDR